MPIECDCAERWRDNARETADVCERLLANPRVPGSPYAVAVGEATVCAIARLLREAEPPHTGGDAPNFPDPSGEPPGAVRWFTSTGGFGEGLQQLGRDGVWRTVPRVHEEPDPEKREATRRRIGAEVERAMAQMRAVPAPSAINDGALGGQRVQVGSPPEHAPAGPHADDVMRARVEAFNTAYDAVTGYHEDCIAAGLRAADAVPDARREAERRVVEATRGYVGWKGGANTPGAFRDLRDALSALAALDGKPDPWAEPDDAG